MPDNVSFREKSPMLAAFPARHEFLGPEEEAAADTATRIRAIWPFLVRKVLAFQGTLRTRERAAYDSEDTLAELYVALAERDARWSPERGRYITFAGPIIDHELYAIRDKARTIHAPRNSLCRIKKYRDEEAAGTLTDARRLTLEDIRRTSSIAGSIGTRGASEDKEDGFEPTIIDDPLATLAARERADGMRSGLRDEIARLNPIDAHVVTRLAGLDDAEATTARDLATELGRTPVEIRRAKERALAKIRKRLADTHHPAFHERN